MKHLHKGRIFGREKSQRHALLKALTHSFFQNMKMQTTLAKAKEVRPVLERMITHAKGGTLAKTRLIAQTASPEVAKKIFETAKQHAGRAGGYTRIVKLGHRKSDGAEMAVIELVK